MRKRQYTSWNDPILNAIFYFTSVVFATPFIMILVIWSGYGDVFESVKSMFL